MEDIIKIVKSLEDSGSFLKGVIETIQNEVENGGFLGILLGTLGASLLGNMLTGNRIIRAGYGTKDLQSKKEEGIIRAGYESSARPLIKDLQFKNYF